MLNEFHACAQQLTLIKKKIKLTDIVNLAEKPHWWNVIKYITMKYITDVSTALLLDVPWVKLGRRTADEIWNWWNLFFVRMVCKNMKFMHFNQVN